MSIPGRIPRGIFGTVLQLSQRRPVFTADFYSIDSGTEKVGSFIDWNDFTHTLSQTGGSSFQVAVPTPHADFGGKLCATWTSISQFYQSNRSAASFSYGNDGSGLCSWAHVGTSGYSGFAVCGVSTCDLTSPLNGSGVSMFHHNAVGFRALISNGAANIINHSPGVGGTPLGSSRLILDIKSHQNPVSALYRNGVLLSTATTTAVFNSAAPKTSMILGATTGANGFIQRQRAWGWMPFMGTNMITVIDSLLAQI